VDGHFTDSSTFSVVAFVALARFLSNLKAKAKIKFKFNLEVKMQTIFNAAMIAVVGALAGRSDWRTPKATRRRWLL
jgi:hypothetical protein